MNPFDVAPGLSSRQLRKMAKKLAKANPQLRKIYEQSRAENPDLDIEVDKMTEELEESINERNSPKSKPG